MHTTWQHVLIKIKCSNDLDSCNVEWTPGEYLRLHFGIISQIKPWAPFFLRAAGLAYISLVTFFLFDHMMKLA